MKNSDNIRGGIFFDSHCTLFCDHPLYGCIKRSDTATGETCRFYISFCFQFIILLQQMLTGRACLLGCNGTYVLFL